MKTKNIQKDTADRDVKKLWPPSNIGTSSLREETFPMMLEQRDIEKKGHRALAKVNHVVHEEKLGTGSEEALQNGIPQHPYFADTQRFDGIDPNTSPEPPLNSEARKEYDEKRNEQELQLKKRLELDYRPEFNPQPKY